METTSTLPAPRWYEQRRALFCGGNRVRLLRYGIEYFAALEAAFAEARTEIFLETYIFHDDPVSMRVADALIAAAGRGVRVHVLVDGFGSLHSIAAVRAKFKGTGVALLVFRPFSYWSGWFSRTRLRRMHRKMCVIDERIGFVGGINVIDDRLDLHHGRFEVPRLDYAVRVEGPIVQPIAHTIEQTWLRVALRNGWRDEVRGIAERDDRLAHLRDLFERAVRAYKIEDLAAYANLNPVRAAFVVRDNFRQRRTIERSYIQAIVRARHRIAIITPYFYPGRTFRKALLRAAARGVRVQLVLQGRIDYKLAGWAARAMYDDFIRAGVEVYEYTRSYLHAKVAVADDLWATVGSSNIDPLSLLVAREANIIVVDRDCNAALSAEIDQAMRDSVPVDGKVQRRRGWLERLAHRWAVLVARFAIMLAGRGGSY